MVSQNSSFLEKQQTAPSGTTATEVKIILYLKVNPSKFKSNNSRKKKIDIKSYTFKRHWHA